MSFLGCTVLDASRLISEECSGDGFDGKHFADTVDWVPGSSEELYSSESTTTYVDWFTESSDLIAD